MVYIINLINIINIILLINYSVQYILNISSIIKKYK